MQDGVLEGVLSDIREVVIIYDRSFKILMVNGGAREMLGIDPAALTGVVFSLDAARDPRFAALAPLFYASLAPTVLRLTEPGVNPTRIKVVLDSPRRVFVITTREQKEVFVKTIQDVTREESLLASKGDFITIAAHQLRTPMTAVEWTFDSLLKDTTLPANLHETVQSGSLAARRIIATVNQLLNAAQMEEGRFGYSFAPLDLGAFLTELVAAASLIATQYGALVASELGVGQIMISADPEKLGLALSNIIDNGIKYSGRGGRVTVALGVEGERTIIRVSDTGAGIPPEDQPRLFEKFFRASNAKAKAADGSGLGLYLAKNIIEAHHGTIAVESALGQGSTFTISLPIIAR